MYILPQEIEVWYIIPAIRRELARCLIVEHKITYEKAGKILGISKAAISQYLKDKRAAKIKLHHRAIKEVCASCKRLVKGTSSTVKEITKILEVIRKSDLPCEVCGKLRDGILTDCKEIRIKDYIKNLDK
tara:strand:- start:7524 stop:7913 length:390 start_codon:yes stop_codon:yes gene_type:complete